MTAWKWLAKCEKAVELVWDISISVECVTFLVTALILFKVFHVSFTRRPRKKETEVGRSFCIWGRKVKEKRNLVVWIKSQEWVYTSRSLFIFIFFSFTVKISGKTKYKYPYEEDKVLFSVAVNLFLVTLEPDFMICTLEYVRMIYMVFQS